MFADGEKMGTHQSYVERKHDFPGMVTSFFLYLFTGHPLFLTPERYNGNTIINFQFEKKWEKFVQFRNNDENLIFLPI